MVSTLRQLEAEALLKGTSAELQSRLLLSISHLHGPHYCLSPKTDNREHTIGLSVDIFGDKYSNIGTAVGLESGWCLLASDVQKTLRVSNPSLAVDQYYVQKLAPYAFFLRVLCKNRLILIQSSADILHVCLHVCCPSLIDNTHHGKNYKTCFYPLAHTLTFSSWLLSPVCARRFPGNLASPVKSVLRVSISIVPSH